MLHVIKHSITLCCLLVACLSTQTMDAKPVKIIGEIPQKTISINNISHAVFNDLLFEYVDDLGNVDYAAWQNNAFDSLENYLISLSSADPTKKASQENTLSFWINAYNALTIYGILEKYPTSSIKNHTAKLFGYNIWKDLKLQVTNNAYSLDDIEHKILRNMHEPRIHFAIVCASESCPRLLNQAFTGQTLEKQLVTNAEHFFAQTGNFQINQKSGKVKLSSILKWFGEDFGDSNREVLTSITPYLNAEDAVIIKQRKTWKVSYLPYSWELNDQN